MNGDERYSRLLALERLGVVENYEQIRRKSVAIVGVGGVGSVAAEMLVRCGVGKLSFFDYDTVEMANMNRLFFRPKHVGMKKTAAAAKVLHTIDPSVQLCPHSLDIARVDSYEEVKRILSRGGWGEDRPVDLILGCVDNYQARLSLDRIALDLGIPWIESGVAENGISGHIQLVVPGSTACFHCAPPLIVASGIDEATLKRDGVCAASLPTTMAIVAGLLVQNALKFLLSFGSLSYYQGYGGLRDHFPSYVMRPNPDCSNRFCVDRQRDCPLPLLATMESDLVPEFPNTSNDWGIELVDSPPPPSPPFSPSSSATASSHLSPIDPTPGAPAHLPLSLDDLRSTLDQL